MKLNNNEKLEIEVHPDEKILTVWFFTKTLTYSVATMFLIFMILFFIDTMNITTENIEKNNSTSVEQQKNNNNEETASKKIEHPFNIFIDYWGWALVLVILISTLIQIYLVFLRGTFRYIVTDKRCIFVGGILKRVERSVPFTKITDIQRSQNILERILGIWNVQIFTPGTASMQVGHAKVRAELNFDGVKNSEELYEIINQYTQLNP